MEKKDVYLYSWEGSHIAVASGVTNVFLEKYKIIKILEFDQFIKKLENLNTIATTNETNKHKDHVIVLFNHTFITEDSYKDIIDNPILSDLDIYPLSLWDDSNIDFLKQWSKILAHIQKKLTNIDICFLFTTYRKKDNFNFLLSICKEQGLKNFRFIADPFLARELEEEVDKLLLRFYTNRKEISKHKHKKKKKCLGFRFK